VICDFQNNFCAKLIELLHIIQKVKF